MAKITEYLEVYTKQYLLDLALSQVPDDIDTRQGAIIYDTLAIVCAKMADVFMEVKDIVEQSYILTATDDDPIDYRVAERGITRYQATKAQRLGTFTYADGTSASVPIGSLFSTIDENKANIINFKVVSEYVVEGIVVPGNYVLECETAGTVGNTYYGEILPLSDMDTLGTATLSTVLTPARAREENDSVKERYFATFNIEAFGGNLADYRQYMREFQGVGQSQIYPRTDVDDTIIISCVDPSNQPISTEYQNTIKQTLDPENYYDNGNNTSGMGLGVVPIGHKITVTAPKETVINVDLTIIKGNTAYIETVKDNIIANLTAYIKQVQDNWADGDGQYETIIYYNQIVTAANGAEGVTNVDGCVVNGGTQNIVLTQTKTTQFIPVLGTVNIGEA